ncbi:MAG: rod shape-determining protein MreC [Gammaproteobacteria bacterium]|nr:rod shape-determining protein MreC [Gammaproteobacteria bacterium]
MKQIFAAGPALSTRLLIAVSFSLILMVLDHRTAWIEPLRSSLSVLTYPVYLIADTPNQAAEWLGEITTNEQSLLDQKRELEKERTLLQAKLQKLEALEAENLRLRNLLDSSFKVGERVLIAELSSVELDPYRQQVVISKGTRSGVFTGQPVLDAQAVMGQVINTSPLHSTVLLITDASHALPVQVLRNGLRTVAVGTGEVNRLSLPFLAHNADIQPGDTLVTSGLGGIFPPGYPVAKVSDISRQPGQHFSSINAEPLAHLDRSREVLLVWNIEQNIPASSETQPEDVTPETEATTEAAETTDPETQSRGRRDG